MALVSGSTILLLKTMMLEVHFPSSPRFRIEALFLIHKKRDATRKSHILFRLSFLKAAAIQEQRSIAEVTQNQNVWENLI